MSGFAQVAAAGAVSDSIDFEAQRAELLRVVRENEHAHAAEDEGRWPRKIAYPILGLVSLALWALFLHFVCWVFQWP